MLRQQLSFIKTFCPKLKVLSGKPKTAWRLSPTLNISHFIGILADYWLIVKKWKDGGRVF